MEELQLTPKQRSAVDYFAKIMDDCIKSYGRSILFTLLLDKDKCCIYVQDSKNNKRTLRDERVFALREYLSVMISELSSEQERYKRFNKSNGRYNFKDVLFSMVFAEPAHQLMFGHKFQISIIPQSSGRVLPVGITLLHTEQEWRKYEDFCNNEVEKTSDILREQFMS